MKNSISKIILTVSFSLTTLGVYPQSSKYVFKKYIQADSSAIHSAATLILYADSSFINFGILNDKENFDNYIWYTVGTWEINKEEQIICNSHFEKNSREQCIAFIKENYKKHRDHRMIENYYEFVEERFENLAFPALKNKVLDMSKKFVYAETEDAKQETKTVTKSN